MQRLGSILRSIRYWFVKTNQVLRVVFAAIGLGTAIPASSIRIALMFGAKWFTIRDPVTRSAFCAADVVKLVDTPDLGSGAARRGGSSPSIRTITVRLRPKPVS